KTFTSRAVFNIQSAEKADIFHDIQIFEYGDFLGNDADALFNIIIVRIDFFSENLNLSLIELQYGEHAVDGRRFTAAVRAEETDDFIVTGRKGKVVESDDFFISFDHIFHEYHF